MEVTNEKNMKDNEIKKQAKIRQDIENPRSPKLDAITRSTSYDSIMIVVSVLYAIQVAVVVIIEDRDQLGNRDMIALAVCQFLFICIYLFELVFNLFAKGP